MNGYHGTITGARYHSRDKTPVCAPCREAACAGLADVRKRRYLAGGTLVGPTIGTARRLQALSRMGWSFIDLAARLGTSKEVVSRWARADRIGHFMRTTTIVRVAEVYEQLCMTPGGSVHATNRAIAKGWVGPMDWDDIDDPGAVSHAAVEAAHAEALREAVLRRKRVEKQAAQDRLREDPARYAEHLRKRAAQRRDLRRRDPAESAA